jgi:long-chain acyl-CoA synthetase
MHPYLLSTGIREHCKIGLISNNRWEWAALASAAYSLNAAIVPMYETQLPKDWEYILNDSECSALFCSTEEIFRKALKEVLPNTPSVQSTLCFNSPSGEPHSLSTLIENAEGQETQVIAPTPDDLAGLIYTSGTTGKPKGVELTHDNFVSNVYAVRTMADDPKDFIRSSDRSLAFLPWAHSYGQTCELWCAVSHGGSMGICRGVPQILEDLAMVKPTVLFAVPTLYKKVYDGVQNLIGTSSPTKQKLMRAALEMGRKKKESGGNLGLVDGLKYKLLDSLVTSKIRGRFGGNLRHGFVAGAACPKEIIDFMDDIGIPICEGYGLTETSPIIAISTPYPGSRKLGNVGKAVGGVNVVIMDPDTNQPAKQGEEGEICCYGRNVMRGYYRNPEATSEVISVAPDGKSRL